MESRAQELFEKWRSEELETQKQVLEEAIREKYEAEFQRWRQKEEKKIRQDAVSKSRAAIMGQVAEHFIPYLPGFRYNPKDAKFLGKPVDFIVFDGMSGGNLRKIVFIEVKTERYSKLSKIEKQVKKL
ncbi:Holliday junction resolvase-like protein [Thermococcus sp. GR6]|uniref:Holliday junction resolvase-like protein n=1 Tax=Thermococcus sp. GR6 TaxID=1638256 RepID=UPI00197F1752|nr:Holliday junction resolvase-like protein [Thermococcus sp. GR6]